MNSSVNLYVGIDPGPAMSAYVVWDAESRRVVKSDIVSTHTLLALLESRSFGGTHACEMVACYGMPVGREVFETCLWIGRYLQALNGHMELVYRKDIKIHFCNSMKAKDSNISQALKDEFGEVGTKRNPGPLYGIKSHLWSALAVATYQASKDSKSVLV